MSLLDKNFQDLKLEPYYNDLNFEQRRQAYQYFNNKNEFADSQYKQQYYQLAKRDAQKGFIFAKAIVFLTSNFERIRWDIYDSVGVGTNDLLDYKKGIQTFSNYVKVAGVVGAVALFYFLFKKGK